jgi:elongation factor 3
VYVFDLSRVFLIIGLIVGSEIWNVEAGRVTHKGKSSVIEDAFADGKSSKGSGSNTPVRSRGQTPAASVNATPAASGTEDNRGSAVPAARKKKMTRNQMKAQEERRRIRKLNWLAYGGPKPEDTDED